MGQVQAETGWKGVKIQHFCNTITTSILHNSRFMRKQIKKSVFFFFLQLSNQLLKKVWQRASCYICECVPFLLSCLLKAVNPQIGAKGNILPLSPCSFEKASHRKTRHNLKRKLLGLMILKDSQLNKGCNLRSIDS